MTRENEFTLNDDDEDEDEVETWDGEGEWNNENEEPEGDVKDESAAYLEFLNDQACSHKFSSHSSAHTLQAQKFNAANTEDDDDLEEESMLDSPLDKIEPYTLFKTTLLSQFAIYSAYHRSTDENRGTNR